MKGFIIRLLNLVLIAGALGGYNLVLEHREQQEEIARLEAELESSRLQLKNMEEESSSEHTESEESLMDGTYTGQADGFGGTIEVEVIIEDGTITDVVVVSAKGEDTAYLSAAEAITDVIIEAQSADVDTISGATFSSTGIRDAAAQAIEKAQQ